MAMDDMLVHRPTFQAVEVLVKPLVSPGQERLLTSLAPMEGGGAADHLPSDTAWSEFKIINNPCVPLVVQPGDLRPLAKGALVAPNLDLPVGPRPLDLPSPAMPYTEISACCRTGR
jgi:hypothetical protein